MTIGVVREMNSFFSREHFFGLICVAAGDVSKILQVKKSVYTFILSSRPLVN